MRTPPVIVIGMHRSGTSMLTRFLAQAGVFMGQKLDMNHEALFFYKLNKWILQQAGATWDNPHNYHFTDQHFKECITRVIHQNLRGLGRFSYLGFPKGIKFNNIQKINFPWGWKDPVNTLTLDIWKSIFPDAKVIFIYRHPLDVAASLATRTHKRMAKFARTKKVKLKEKLLYKEPIYAYSYRTTDTLEAIKLWEQYNKAALEHLEKIPKEQAHLIKYEDLLQQPEKHFSALLNFLELPPEKGSVASFTSKLDSSRIYSFMNNSELLQVYEEQKEREMIVKFGYGNRPEHTPII